MPDASRRVWTAKERPRRQRVDQHAHAVKDDECEVGHQCPLIPRSAPQEHHAPQGTGNQHVRHKPTIRNRSQEDYDGTTQRGRGRTATKLPTGLNFSQGSILVAVKAVQATRYKDLTDESRKARPARLRDEQHKVARKLCMLPVSLGVPSPDCEAKVNQCGRTHGKMEDSRHAPRIEFLA
eukprot:7371576-Prymnesium_polylepis.2